MCILQMCDQGQFRTCKEINQTPEELCLNRTLTAVWENSGKDYI